MNVLVCGADGFIGRHLCAALAAAGHHVRRGVRRPRLADDVAIDYMRDLRADDWIARLAGIDAVVNAVGILSEDRGKRFDAIHRDAPIALFDACARAGVPKLVQISALGGMSNGNLTPYMHSKREADAHLSALDLNWTILRPSLVVGADGASSRLFRMLASLPVIGLPGHGEQQLQPVHIDDLCAAVVRALRPDAAPRAVIDVVGPRAMSYRAMLGHYRDALGLASAVWLPIPMPVMRIAAAVAAKLPQKVLAPETLRMLEEHNVADPGPVTDLLGRAPKGPASWFANVAPDMLRAQALTDWLWPLLRWSLAVVWIVTGLLSLGIFPVEQSLELLRMVGLQGNFAMAALIGAALLDFALGVATIMAPGRWLWRAQMILVLGYTAIITMFLPQFWLHPFGPVLKNLPILAILFALDAAETRRG